MLLGVMAAMFGKWTLPDTLKYCKEQGLDAIELPAGGYPGDPWDLNGIHKTKWRLRELKARIADAGLVVKGIAVHGNPLHPNRAIAKEHHLAQRNAVHLAAAFETVVVTFSGLPGAGPKETIPSWITNPWPDEHLEALKWQWNKVAVPYWTVEAKYATLQGTKFALEAHPNMIIHQPRGIVDLRGECGNAIGANPDLSHWLWRGIDALKALQFLLEHKCVFHFHAKDCFLNRQNIEIIGNIDTQSFINELLRAWVFCTVGFGHGSAFWAQVIRMLRAGGYDGVISIEHEDAQMSSEEGLKKAIALLQRILLRELAGKPHWFANEEKPTRKGKRRK